MNTNPLLRWWFTPKLPDVHIFISEKGKPKGLSETLSIYFRKWVIHPIKRRIAKYYLMLLQKAFGLTVIATTGSAGKTSTKEMIAAILRRKGSTVISFANIDPVYNIPTTILSARPWTKYLVLEMGVEYPGEMDFYLWLATPHIAVVTNIYPTHTLFLKSIEGVAKEKRKLTDSLKREDFAILNSDNRYTREFGKTTKAKVIWFGGEGKIKAVNSTFNKDLDTRYTLKIGSSKISILLPILGNQFIQNSLAAASVGYALGVSLKDIKEGIESFTPPPHRMRPIKLTSGALVIDDSYNNNPKAAEEALKTFNEVVGERKKIIVFGDMLELGDLEKEEHQRIGRMINSMNVSCLIGVGPASKLVVDEVKKKIGEKAIWINSNDEVIPILSPLLKKDTITLIKGSRSIGLEKVVEAIKDEKD